MFRKFSLFVLAVSILSSAGYAQENLGPDVPEELTAAQKKAADSGRDIFIVLTGPKWCPPCKALEENVFSNRPAVEMLERQFVTVYSEWHRVGADPAHREADRRHLKIRDFLQVRQGYPAMLLANAQGRIYYVKSGYLNTQTAAAFVNELLAKRMANLDNARILALLAEAEKNPKRNKELLLGASKRLRSVPSDALYLPSMWKLAELFGADAPKARSSWRRAAASLELGSIDTDAYPDRTLDLVTMLLEECSADFDRDPQLKEFVLRMRVRAYDAKSQPKKALATLKEIRTFAPDVSRIDQEIDWLERQVQRDLELSPREP